MQPATYTGGMFPLIGRPLDSELWHCCVGAWAPCLGPTGLTVYDWCGAKHHGTLTNMPADMAWISSQGRYTLNFPEGDDRITLSSANSGPLYDRGTGDFAISLWLTAAAGTYRGVLGNMTTFGNGILLGRNTTNWGGYLGNSTELNSGYSIPTDGTWHHYGVQRSGSTISWWVDGLQTATTHTNSNSMAGASATTLGFCNGYARWPGNIDDVRIYSCPLIARQWKQLATRRGIAYELAPRRRSTVQVVGGFNPAWVRRRSLVIGGGIN